MHLKYEIITASDSKVQFEKVFGQIDFDVFESTAISKKITKTGSTNSYETNDISLRKTYRKAVHDLKLYT